MAIPLKLDHLYVAFQYPENPIVNYEQRPDFLPENLRMQANGDPELEYTWSFIISFKLNGEALVKQIALVSLATARTNPEALRGPLPNKHLQIHDLFVEVRMRHPGALANIPRLMVLLEIQPIDRYSFEEFLCTHHDVTNWALIDNENHATHLWVRNILIDYEAIDINDDTIMKVEEAARECLRKHKLLRRGSHDWTSPAGTPLWRAYVYDANYPSYYR
ncbi:hypothetical protein F4680DRAFT_443237 [Xylaria scruposa]|nr:hypothetical protein F4680DRAFT_443237 [Xylaria scruposa]